MIYQYSPSDRVFLPIAESVDVTLADSHHGNSVCQSSEPTAGNHADSYDHQQTESVTSATGNKSDIHLIIHMHDLH